MVGTSLTMTAERLEDPEPAGPMSDARFDIVSIARTWLGTPYHYQASLRGVSLLWRRLGFLQDQVFLNLAERGNCLAASTPLAL